MTNEELLADLKQFIEATVAQQTGMLERRIDSIEARMATKDDLTTLATKDDLAVLERRLDDMDEKLDEIQNAIGETVVTVDDTLGDHERRITRLEHRSA